MIRKLTEWVEHRTGLETAVKEFLYEDIPASSGWHQVLGSVALFAFLIQIFTGIMLAFNYAPTPGEAYNSVRYIMTEVTGGRLMRGLHHWGASLMIVVVVFHMIQVFVYGAYKKPREATWIVGVVLLLLTMGYGLTGYLLPWDNRAYWGTVVATKIGASAPGAGPYVARLLGTQEGISVITFARFYALHVLLLPPLTLLLIGVHVYLVRKHGVAPAAIETAPKKKFFPEQVFKDTLAIFAAFAILFTLAIVARVPLDRLADPTDTSYVPRPDWYFLFLFQMLKLFEGPLELVGTIILPTLAILALFLIPFVDRGAMKRVRQRTVAIGIVFLAALGWTGLTVAAIKSTPPTPEVDITSSSGPEPWQQLTPDELAGIGYFRKDACNSCHVGEKKLQPDPARAQRRDTAWLMKHFRQPDASKKTQLNGSQLSTLAAFTVKMTTASMEALDAAPQNGVDGAMIYQQQHCNACHQVNGSGTKQGPALNGVGQRRSREWIEEHFANPQKVSPGTSMPAYKFSSRDMDRITAYVLAIP